MKLSSFLRLKLTFAYKFLENLRELYKDIKTANFESFDLQEIERLSGIITPLLWILAQTTEKKYLIFSSFILDVKYMQLKQIQNVLKDQNRFKKDSRVKCFNLAIADINGTINLTVVQDLQPKSREGQIFNMIILVLFLSQNYT